MSPSEALALCMFFSFIALVFTGFPIAWILGGLSVFYTTLAIVLEIDLGFATGVDWAYTSLSVDRIWNVMENWVMVALPMFILMGLLLDRSGIARNLLLSVARLLGPVDLDYYHPYEHDAQHRNVDEIVDWAGLPRHTIGTQKGQAILFNLAANSVLNGKRSKEYWRVEQRWMAGEFRHIAETRQNTLRARMGVS